MRSSPLYGLRSCQLQLSTPHMRSVAAMDVGAWIGLAGLALAVPLGGLGLPSSGGAQQSTHAARRPECLFQLRVTTAAAKRMLGEPMANLSDGERILHVARRKELYEKLHPETKHGGDRRSAGARSSSLTPMRCSAGAPREKLRTTPCKGRSVKQKDLSSRRQLRVREPARSCTWLCTLAQRMAPGSKGKPS